MRIKNQRIHDLEEAMEQMNRSEAFYARGMADALDKVNKLLTEREQWRKCTN